MKWTVLWKPSAENALSNIWVAAPDKSAVTKAANHLDARLRSDPLNTGESRAANERVEFDSPLGILFSVDSLGNTVHVLRVWRVSS